MGDGRHRADPKGHSHYLVGALGVFLLIALLAGGGYTLHGALTTTPEPPPASVITETEPSSSAGPSVFAAASPTERASRNDSAPTLAIQVVGERCYVNVKTADGTVLVDRTLTNGERFTTGRPNLQVTVGDSGAAEIYVNGSKREQGERGELETFTVGGGS